ncbi:hypothetical protein CHCC15291_4585 [Bacillus licheniformis]|nr:hypothetical protein CHCC15291_4585 [Bacillus licheniformis]TWM01700.1 hypothetical protein CHCC15289_3080 [Bacillus licheniformis]
MAKRKANHVINGMNNAKRQGNGAGYIENDQHILRRNAKTTKNGKPINKYERSFMNILGG